MAFKIIEPGRSGGTVRARNVDRSGGPIGSENISSAPDLQAFRAAHLARRFRLSPLAASVVASLAFGEAHA